MSEYIRLQANGADAYPDASTENTYRPNGTSVESALVNLESNVTTLGGVAGEAKTLAEQNSVKIATAEQEISDINSSLSGFINTTPILNFNQDVKGSGDYSYTVIEDGLYSITNYVDPKGSTSHESNAAISINNITLQRNKCSGYYAVSSVSMVIPLKAGDVIEFSYAISGDVTDTQKILLYKLF